MSKHQKFFLCKHCGNLAGLINDAGVPMVCCGEPMTELKANTSEGAKEKHLPVAECSENEVTIKVGSTYHPMGEDHHIAWVYLQTNEGGHRKAIPVTSDPVVTFALSKKEKPIAAFAYCNLHGLWKTDIE